MSVQAQTILRELLMELFESREFYRHLYGVSPGGLPLGKDLLDNLQRPEDTSKAQFFFQVSRELVRSVPLMQALFPLLHEARPGQEVRIARAQQDIASLAEQAPSLGERRSRPVPSPTNPFAPFATFVGRQRELGEVRSALKEGRAAVLIAGRRAGKTAAWSDRCARLSDRVAGRRRLESCR